MGEYRRSGSRFLIETPDGRVVFCPDGVFGRPYILPAGTYVSYIRALMRLWMVLACLLGPVLVPLVGWRIALVSAVILCCLYEVGIRIIVALLNPTPQRLSLREGFRVQAAAASSARLEGMILMLIMSMALVAFLSSAGRLNRFTVLGIVCIAVLLTAVLFQMLRTKKMLDRTGIDPMNKATPANPRLQPTGQKAAGG